MSGAAIGIGTSRASLRRSQRTQSILIHIVLIAGAIVVMIPLAWMLSTSLKPPHQITKFPPIWIPDPFEWSNYIRAVTIFPVSFLVFIRNSMYMSLMITLGTVLSNAVVAFAFARLQFRGSRVLFIIVLSTMMLPQQVTMIPLFILFSKIGWINSYNPLIVPHFFANAYFIFLLRQFYSTIPRELDDAARIDGCSVIGLFVRILLPLSKPALGITRSLRSPGRGTSFWGP